MKTILFATDGSDSAGEALEFAIELAKETGAEIDVLAVKPPPVLSKGGVGLPILEVEEDQGAEHIAATAVTKAEGSACTPEPMSSTASRPRRSRSSASGCRPISSSSGRVVSARSEGRCSEASRTSS